LQFAIRDFAGPLTSESIHRRHIAFRCAATHRAQSWSSIWVIAYFIISPHTLPSPTERWPRQSLVASWWASMRSYEFKEGASSSRVALLSHAKAVTCMQRREPACKDQNLHAKAETCMRRPMMVRCDRKAARKGEWQLTTADGTLVTNRW
jgi:hypothetical protein